jgi:energy-coupling factor transporter ATP-binding protein EcfA2
MYQDWSYVNDAEGMIDISCWDPFRVMWEPGFRRRDLKDCNYLINRGWYSPEEIRNMYALDKDDLYDEITEKAKMYLGTTRDRERKLIPYIERTFGPHLSGYQGKDQGYDEVTLLVDGMLYNNGNYFDGQASLFKVIEFHERRQEKKTILYDPNSNNRWDVTKAVQSDTKNGVADRSKVVALRDRMMERGNDAIVTTQVINQIYQTAVCPSFNLVLYDEPYAVQNGLFKLTPVFCFDFGQESMDWKSYVDHLIDPVSGYNLKMNTLTTYLQKATTHETWAEEDALGEHEDAFLENKIGALKYIKTGKLDKVKQIMPAGLPPGITQGAEIDKTLLKEISGVRDNALGTQESSSESGKLYNSRVAQSDILQTLVQDNAVLQMKVIGEVTKDNILHYMEPDRVIRMVGDEGNPYWLELNQEAVRKLFYDKESGEITNVEEIPGNVLAGKYDIVLSKAPFGEAAKQREFDEMMMLTNVALTMNRPDYVKFEYLIKNSRLRVKDDWIIHVNEADGMMQQQQQAMQQQQEAQISAEQMQKELEMQDKALDMKEKEKEHQAENLLRAGMLKAVSQ